MNLFLKPDLYNILSQLYSHDRVMETMKVLRDLERPRQYTAFNDSTAWCTKVLQDAGFSDVRRIAHKADGKTASYDFVMPQAWDLLGRSTLEIVEPERKMIADTDLSTIYVSEYSAPTPEGGITAELVAYTALDPNAPDCKGKYVYYPYYLPAQHPLYNTLAKAGCAGIVFAPYGTTAHEPDVPSWTNGHGHIGWYHLKEDPVVPVFCVSPKTGIELSMLLSKGKVVLHGEIKAKIYDGEIYTVTGTIPGKSEEEFALLAHLYEPFYADDCQGFAAGVEVALMLKKLIDEGVLPQPEKTLRLIFSMERYGFAAFFANHDKKILAALSIDTITCYGNGLIERGFVIKESPLSLPFFGDMLLYEAMRTHCADLRWNTAPGNLSDDCWSSEPTVNIPTNWLVASSNNGKYDYHHCDAPVFDGIQPKALAKLTPLVALYTAALVCGDREHFAKMAVELEKIAFNWMEVQRNYLAGQTAAGRMTKEEALMYKKAAELLYHGRMDSFNRFYPGLVTPKIPEHWADEFYTTLPDRELSATEQKAVAIRYRITSVGMPFSFDRIPYEERVSWPGIPELIWALLNPERSVLEAIRLHDGAFAVTTSDEKIEYYLSYFAYLAKYGYLEEIH